MIKYSIVNLSKVRYMKTSVKELSEMSWKDITEQFSLMDNLDQVRHIPCMAQIFMMIFIKELSQESLKIFSIMWKKQMITSISNLN